MPDLLDTIPWSVVVAARDGDVRAGLEALVLSRECEAIVATKLRARWGTIVPAAFAGLLEMPS